MRSGWFVWGALATCLVSGAARAEPTIEDRALAEALFRDGKELIAAGKVAEACPKFAESQRLDPKLGTLLYVATCHEQQGKTASAWIEFTEAASLASRTRQTDRERLARERASALEHKLDRLVVVVKGGAAGIEVKLDDRPLGAAVLGTPVPIDPGPHKLSATAPQKKTWTTTVTFDVGPATQTVEVPALEDEAAAPPPPPPPPPVQPVVVAPVAPPPPTGAHGVPLGTYILGGVSLAALGGFAGFWLAAVSDAKDLRAACAVGCAHADAGPIRTKATVADVFLGVSIAAAVGAAAVYVLASPSRAPSSETKSASVDVVALPSGAAVTMSGAFR